MIGAPASRLKIGLNGWTVRELPAWSSGPTGGPRERLEVIWNAGHHHLQMEDDDPLRPEAMQMSFALAGAARADTPEAVRTIAARHADQGLVLTTLHLGTGFERATEAARLVEAVLETSVRLGYPLYVETHRATLTQDPFRTLELVEAFPDLEINADLSHWCTGVEFVYGDFAAKLDRLEPVFQRVRYVQGRVGDSGSIQVPVDLSLPRPCHAHFHELWRRCFQGFLATAPADANIVFAPELLPNALSEINPPTELNYARLEPDNLGGWREESDRWQQAQVLGDMARKAFYDAGRRVARPTLPLDTVPQV